MGYTHYWRRISVLPRASFAKFVADLKLLDKAMPSHNVELACAGGEGLPEFTNSMVSFNGLQETGYESFILPRERTHARLDDNGMSFDFCKTDRRPYDLMVVAALCAARHHFGKKAFLFSSDGSIESLQPGYDLWVKTCNPKNPAALTELLEPKS